MNAAPSRSIRVERILYRNGADLVPKPGPNTSSPSVRQFTMVETLTTALFDEWPQLRARKGAVVMGTSLIGFILGLW